jgi:hypothetical protein
MGTQNPGKKFCAVAPNSLVPQYETGFMLPSWRLEFCEPLITITVSIFLRLTGTWATFSYFAVNLFLCYPV